MLDKGELWALFRHMMDQGSDIRLDYKAGKYPSYEHYSARMDEAARERVNTFLAALRGSQPSVVDAEHAWLREGWISQWLIYTGYSEDERYDHWIDEKPKSLD